jgi:hypothetical protein
VPDCEPRVFERPQVVREQVGGHAQLCLKLRGGKVPEGQEVHNAQARRIGERGMPGNPQLEGLI